jgi:ABC-type glycerol-3-phosphate transport system permease component
MLEQKKARMTTRVSSQNKSKRLRIIAIYAFFILFTLIVLLPFYWLIRSSLIMPKYLFETPPIYFTNDLTPRNFITLFEQIPFYEYTRNSVVLAVSASFLSVAISFMAAYAFARIRFPASNLLLWILILSMALPEIGTIVPLYRTLSTFKLLDTLNGLILVLSSAMIPFTVWVLVSFIKQVPYEIEEAAIVDGANILHIFWRILIPVTAPGLVTMLLINFVGAWNNMLFPLSFSVTPASKTLSVAITEVYAGYSPYGKPWELIMAVGLVMVIPVIIMVLFSQKAIVRGLTAGAVKG